MVQQTVPETWPEDLFLLHAGNRRFLEGSSRRIIGGSSLSQFVVGGLLIALLGSVVSPPGQELGKALLLAVAGHKERGTIVQCSPTIITYNFPVWTGPNEGYEYTVEQHINGNTCDRLKVGWDVTVSYWPEDPTVVRLVGSSADNSDRDISILLALLVVLLLIALLPLQLRTIRQNRYLVRNGNLVQGSVVDSKSNWLSSKRSIEVSYTFTLSDGRNYSGTNIAYGSGYTFPPHGTPVAVLYANDKRFRML